MARRDIRWARPRIILAQYVQGSACRPQCRCSTRSHGRDFVHDPFVPGIIDVDLRRRDGAVTQVLPNGMDIGPLFGKRIRHGVPKDVRRHPDRIKVGPIRKPFSGRLPKIRHNLPDHPAGHASRLDPGRAIAVCHE